MFYEVRFIELSLKEKKLQYFVQESISIILVFNLEDRTSFENLGNKMIQLKKIYKFENYLFILGSSPNNDESNNIDNKEEIKCLMQTCELKGKYEEISQYNQDKINCFFNSVLISSIESLKSKKKSDKSSINTSCIIFWKKLIYTINFYLI